MIMKREAMPELPEKLYGIHEVSMTLQQRDIYLQLQRKLVAEVKQWEEDVESGRKKYISATHVLTKMLRLAQVTSGFLSFDAELSEDGESLLPRQIDRLDPNPKIEAIVEILKDKKPEQKTIIWACWVQDIKTILARLKLENIDAVGYWGGTKEADREEAIRRFNGDPRCKVFVGNPGAGGVGINLRGYHPDDPECNTNCDMVIYFSQDWSPTKRSQSEDRAHRRGTRTNVTYIDLVVPGTIDEEIRARVIKKREHALTVQDVRGIMQRVIEAIPQTDGDS